MQIRGDIIVAGNLVEDILVRPVERIEYGATVWVDSIDTHLGGNGANTSYALRKLGICAKLKGAVGRDDFGRRVLERLSGAGVDLSNVEQLDEPTATTVVLVAPDGSRSFLHRPGVSRVVFAETLAFDSGPGHFHLANIFSLPNMRRTGAKSLENAKTAGWTTSLDLGHDTKNEWMKVLEPCLPSLDILFANEAESLRVSGQPDVRSAAKALQGHGVKLVVVKRGAAGCAVFHEKGEFWAKGFSIPAVDTTGAGDCFTAGFLAGLAKGNGLADAARLANACGALSASAIGSVAGLKSFEETVEWMKTSTVGP